MVDFASKLLMLDNYFDKIFYINLKKDTVRNESLISQFKKFGITNYERIEAIEMKGLPTPYAYRNFIQGNNKNILAQVSCRASHIHIVKIAKQRNYSKILIFEDDIIFLEDPNVLLANNMKNLQDWDMLYFGGDVERHFRNQIVRAHAYAVKNTLYDNIIHMAEASGMEIDNFYAKILQQMSYNYNPSGKYNISILMPFNQVVQNPAFQSNICFK